MVVRDPSPVLLRSLLVDGRGDVCELKIRRLSEEDDDSVENLKVNPNQTDASIPSAIFFCLISVDSMDAGGPLAPQASTHRPPEQL